MKNKYVLLLLLVIILQSFRHLKNSVIALLNQLVCGQNQRHFSKWVEGRVLYGVYLEGRSSFKSECRNNNYIKRLDSFKAQRLPLFIVAIFWFVNRNIKCHGYIWLSFTSDWTGDRRFES